MRIVFLLFFGLFLFSSSIKANESFELTHAEYELLLDGQAEYELLLNDSLPKRAVKFKKGKAIVFTILTGIFGGHRIYFGTHHRTPILYSLTFGGLGILPLIDLGFIIFTKDLTRFERKSQVIMWVK